MSIDDRSTAPSPGAPATAGAPGYGRAVIDLGTQRLTPGEVALVAVGGARFRAPQATIDLLARARRVIDSVLADGLPSYGVNRGLGPMRDQEIPLDLQEQFQHFVLASHAAGVGEALSPAQSRAILAARLAGLAQGGSGISVATFRALVALVDADITPVVTRFGSVGAADLAPLAAIGAVLVGRGSTFGPDGTRVPGAQALAAAGLTPATLGPKDALALVGANSGSIGLACLASLQLDTLVLSSDLVAAMTVEALGASLAPFDEVVAEARPMPGQVASAAAVREAVSGGDLEQGLIATISLQDALSIRTVPQVHGVLHQVASDLREILTVELNSPTDNPLVDVEAGVVRPTGNFSVLELAISAESTRLVLAHVGMLAERRIASLVQRVRSDRPLVDQIAAAASSAGFLTPVILANTASQVVVRLKHLANPLSTAGTTVGDGVEDHSSQAFAAVLATVEAIEATEILLAIETLLAADALSADIARRGSRRLGIGVAGLHGAVVDLTSALGSAEVAHDVVEKVRPLVAIAATAMSGRALRDATWHAQHEHLSDTTPADLVDDPGALRHRLRGSS
ncbi:aromatic amino acid ammonia-lyase [Serinibacter arcticus]|uniref:Histidine ammonia-lyase n=1 Tax=Serinibacter arcticus TaxID=1655435 RepID=A0A4Z1E6F0_9MICO|nr:aromatic amino acid ammonia-lyase [Serinibacter arcticus]TGO06282.1 Histidine ammonia-lyase [Serinibacter arcticus]